MPSLPFRLLLKGSDCQSATAAAGFAVSYYMDLMDLQGSRSQGVLHPVKACLLMSLAWFLKLDLAREKPP